MIINVKGCEEYILCILSQCGEANIDLICDAVPYDDNYVIKMISTLKKKGLVKTLTSKTMKGMEKAFSKDTADEDTATKFDTKYIRIIKDGIGYLKEKDINLYWEICNVTGNMNFYGSDARIVRMKSLADLTCMLIANDVVVDWFEYKKEDKCSWLNKKGDMMYIADEPYINDSIFNYNGSLKNHRMLISEINKNKTNFLTTKALRDIAAPGVDNNSLVKTYRIYGVLIKYDNFYPVYILNTDKGIWYPSMEKKMKSEFSIITRSGINKKNFYERMQTNQNGEAVFLLDDYSTLGTYIREESKAYKKALSIKPQDIYDKSYMIPFHPKEMKDVFSLILIKNWHEKLINFLFAGGVINHSIDIPFDALVEDTPSYELLSCDLRKMQNIYKQSLSEKVKIIVYEWQVEILEKIYNQNVDYIIVNNDFMKMLIDAMNERR